MRNKNGQEVVFGDVIQLFHVKSGKYVTVIPDKLAKDERENIKVILDSRGNSYSWLQVSPRYKINREGDRILNYAEIFLKVSERSNEFVHRADRDPLPGQSREVNCSLEVTYWKLSIFQSSADSIDRSLLLGSELVNIHDPETRCYLTISLPPVENLDEKSEGNAVHEFNYVGTGINENPADPAEMRLTEQSELRDMLVHEFGNIILQPSQPDYTNPSCLWSIEKSVAVNGGPITLKTDQVRFKHLNTGVYLKAGFLEDTDAEGSFIQKPVFVTTEDSTDTSTLFSLKEVNAPGKFLGNAKALQIVQAGVWLERGDVLDSGNYAVKGTADKSIALSLLIQRYVKDPKEEREDHVGSLDKASQSNEPLDVYVGLAARSYLNKYLKMTVIPKSDNVSTLW
ncbi:hypothetical protein EON65_41955, partial [archaeon]